MNAPTRVTKRNIILECAFCTEEIFADETPATHTGQTFHRFCAVLFRLQRLESIVAGLSYKKLNVVRGK